jgi:hypothetical protein
MIQLTVLQFRSRAVAMCALATVAAVAGITRPQLVHLYDTLIAPCTVNGTCGLAIFLGAALLLTGFCFWWVRRSNRVRKNLDFPRTLTVM